MRVSHDHVRPSLKQIRLAQQAAGYFGEDSSELHRVAPRWLSPQCSSRQTEHEVRQSCTKSGRGDGGTTPFQSWSTTTNTVDEAYQNDVLLCFPRHVVPPVRGATCSPRTRKTYDWVKSLSYQSPKIARHVTQPRRPRRDVVRFRSNQRRRNVSHY
jgi:hypothetical protein